MKPDFETMSLAELRTYLLSHRNDNEAFYALVDRLEASADDTALYPLPDTPETIAVMEAAIQEHIKTLDERRDA